MGLGNNSNLLTGGVQLYVENNGVNDSYSLEMGRANQVIISAGAVGDDVFTNFDVNDSLINYRNLGSDLQVSSENGTINTDESGNTTSDDLIVLIDVAEGGLRSLGNKSGSNMYVYADASTLSHLNLSFGSTVVSEGTVGNDRFNAGDGQHVYLYDTALGLNLGGDTIKEFGPDDLIVTTSKIFNGRADGSNGISFGLNDVLDLSGEYTSESGDAGVQHGGQIALNGVYQLFLVNQTTGDNGVQYYFYGTQSVEA
jgi:hypothetical protein